MIPLRLVKMCMIIIYSEVRSMQIDVTAPS